MDRPIFTASNGVKYTVTDKYSPRLTLGYWVSKEAAKNRNINPDLAISGMWDVQRYYKLHGPYWFEKEVNGLVVLFCRLDEVEEEENEFGLVIPSKVDMKTSRAKRKLDTAKRLTRSKKMSETANMETQNAETLLAKADIKNEGVLEIRAENGSAGRLEVYFRHPVLAEVVSKMGMGNYPEEQFDKVYKPCLLPHPNPSAKGRVVSRPAIYNTTKNFVAGTDFDFTQPPRGVLIANHEALRAGFSLFIELKTPVPHDTLRKWGKQLMDGCADIIAASRPFTMSWVMKETIPGKL